LDTGLIPVRLIRSIAEMQNASAGLHAAGKRIGFVPTMGALHEGHLSLIRLARQETDEVVTSVFVNPTQFAPTEDFERYPRNLERDAGLAAGAGSSIIFAPERHDIYPEPFLTAVELKGMDEVLEGKSRPGHFRGVATVVLKLLNIVVPNTVVFGQKDAQQVVVIRRMISDLNLTVRMLVAPTVRESDGLAMSSRNAYLTPEQRCEAPVLFAALQEAVQRIGAGAHDAPAIIAAMTTMITQRSAGIIDYISIADNGTLQEVSTLKPGSTVLLSLAVRFGATRLIDNVVVQVKEKD
jgi:pantoate--beta-alanine ligase